MGPALGGVEFSKGARLRGEGHIDGEMIRSRRGRLYLDDAGRIPEADSIQYGSQVTFGENQAFIGKIGGSEPGPDVCTDNGTQFTSHTFMQYIQDLGSKICFRPLLTREATARWKG